MHILPLGHVNARAERGGERAEGGWERGTSLSSRLALIMFRPARCRGETDGDWEGRLGSHRCLPAYAADIRRLAPPHTTGAGATAATGGPGQGAGGGRWEIAFSGCCFGTIVYTDSYSCARTDSSGHSDAPESEIKERA